MFELGGAPKFAPNCAEAKRMRSVKRARE